MNLHLFDTFGVCNTCFEIESASGEYFSHFSRNRLINIPKSLFASIADFFHRKAWKHRAWGKSIKEDRRGTRTKELIATFGSSCARVLAVWLIAIVVRVCKGYNFHSNGNSGEANTGAKRPETRWPSMKQLRRTNGAQGAGVYLCVTDARLYPVGEDSRQISGNLPRMYPHTILNASP